MRFADGEPQSRNLLLLAAIQQVSRLRKLVLNRTGSLARNDRDDEMSQYSANLN